MSRSADGNTARHGRPYTFLLDSNLGLTIDEPPLRDALAAAGIEPEGSTDLPGIDRRLGKAEPDIAFVPSADFHRLVGEVGRGGEARYRGLAIMTSKTSGQTRLRNVLVVREDDPAESLDDLEGASLGFINTSCTSSYFPPALLLAGRGRTLDGFLDIKPVEAWQGQIDAVVDRQVRATMTMEDVWLSAPRNASTTKVIGRYDNSAGPMVIVRRDVEPAASRALLDALLQWQPRWDAVFGPFRPFTWADVHSFFHDLDGLPADL